ncbi:6034_t:CDS:10 [Diversispora eburnea]|uniref:6034_t:CDS:1 n=1 Tax=Diversispora eburnea TaxID=1213867 RepID=A0A9N9F4A8_9GLOM|nr:6034_t:CDS:10 [Diversispora eburnea]
MNNTDPAANFKSLLERTIAAREKKELETKPLDELYSVIFDNPAKRFKKSNENKDEYILELEDSDTVTKLVQEFFKACLAIGNTGELVNYLTETLLITLTWSRISLILSILGGLITDSPITFGILLQLGGDISHPDSTLQPVIHITIPQIFKYITPLLEVSSLELRIGIISFMLIILKQHPRAMTEITSASSTNSNLALDIIIAILKYINEFSQNFNKKELECIEVGRQMIDALLIGKNCGGIGSPVRGHFINVHWSMEKFVNDLLRRRKRLAFLMMSPGHVASFYSRFNDLLFQRAPFEEVRALIKIMKSQLHPHSHGLEPLREAFFTKVHDVIVTMQQRSNFKDPREDATLPLSPEKTIIPENLDFWEFIIELGDQLYGLVARTPDYMKYQDVLTEFYHMVYPKHGNHFSRSVHKDNTLTWLLVQLCQIDKIFQVLTEDLDNDERLFSRLLQLYNDQQTKSKDAFYLRDLSVPCILILQHGKYRDRNNLKARHPHILEKPLAYSHTIINPVRAYFQAVYRTNVTNYKLFRNLSIEETIKIALHSQCAKNQVADTILVHLYPAELTQVGKLGFPEAKFKKGGNVGYKLLEFINISHKHRLSELIYRMSLFETGPASSLDKKDPCISPYILDVLYKIIYIAPWSLEVTFKEILDKLRRLDKHNKHTKAPDLLHYIKYSVSYLEHRQTYRDVETFAIHIMMMQVDVKFIRSIADPAREKPVWFPESELLARYMIFTLARLIKLRGLNDVHDMESLILSIYPVSIQWSTTTLSYFPEPLRTHLITQQTEILNVPPVPPFTDLEMNSALEKGNFFRLVSDTTLALENEEILKEHYSKLEHQPIFLCSLWKIGCKRKSLNPDMMNTLRKVLLQFPPSKMASYTMTLIDFIIEKIETDSDSSPVEVCHQMLDELIWRYQILSFEHVLFALIKGHSENNSTAFKILEYLLIESNQYSDRVQYFISLGFSHRYWVEDDHHDKMMKYLERYPEYFQYEAYAMDGYETVTKQLEPPLITHMPIYYTNAIRKSLPILDIVIGRLIEFEEQELLIKILDDYRHIYKYHQTPLCFVRDLFCYYYSSRVLREQAIATRLIKLLDFDEYELESELLQYGSNSLFPVEIFDVPYFEKVFHKLADSVSQEKFAPKRNSKLPERHFREIPNPVVLALHIACLEILAIPNKPEDIIKATLDIVVRANGSKKISLKQSAIHTIALLYSFLPVEEFVYKMFDEIAVCISTDPHLGEFSQEFNLIQNKPIQPSKLSYFGINSYQTINDPQWPFSAHSTQPFSTMFPYIFNVYASNLHNFTSNVANSFLTFMHSLLHYSNTEVLQVLFTKLTTIRENVKTDIQLLYLCALFGPVIHRLETNSEFILYIFQLLNDVTLNMRLEICGDTTVALEQSFLFNDPVAFANVQQIIRMMKISVQSRLCGFHI